MNTMLIFVFGFLFGATLQYARVNKYDVISGLAIRKDFTVAKVMALAIGIGMILINVEIAKGLASYHVKPFLLVGITLGGLLFGIGMAILGYCPGTLFISFGEGSIDAFIGITGGLVGGLVYTLLEPSIRNILGPNLGTISLLSVIGSLSTFIGFMIFIGFVFIVFAMWLQRIGEIWDNKWVVTGIALTILNVLVFADFFSDRPIGASTAYPYLADLLTGTTDNEYFEKIKTSGNWELIFLAGAFMAGLVISLAKKEFKVTLLHENWKKYRGTSKNGRILWAFVGGFILIIGARMAGGCTSGHILSGGMQLALSSLTFAVFVFIGLLVTGKYFYKIPK